MRRVGEVSLRSLLFLIVGLLGLAPACGDSPLDDDDSGSSDDDDSGSSDDDDSGSSDDDDSGSSDDDDSAPPVFVPGALIVTEIFNNPQGTDEGREWFELFNPGSEDIDLLGWTLEDFHTNHYLIGESVLVPAGSYAVLGESTEEINLGTPVDFAYGLDGNGFPLGNNTDEIVLISPGGILVDSVAYDGGGTFPSAEGRSLSLSLPATSHLANDMGWNWCLSNAAAFTKEGDLGSPGAANPDC
jgi:hypothetical protein